MGGDEGRHVEGRLRRAIGMPGADRTGAAGQAAALAALARLPAYRRCAAQASTS